MSFTYDPRADRYRSDRGRFVSRLQARAYIDRSISASKNVVGDLAGLAGKGEISPGDFRERMKAEIKGEYIRQYLLGRGGLGSMTPADWGSLGGMLKSQYTPYLQGFYDDLRKGDLSEAEIARRAQMYISSARQAYERGHLKTMGANGRKRVKWNLGNRVEHCSGCLDWAGKGWMDIDELTTVPGAGQTPCGPSCDCSLSYEE